VNERDTPLRVATISQLVAELGRRLNEGELDEPPEAWCEDCVYFRAGTPSQVKRKDWNPCANRHQMQFYTPRPADSPETFGYYRLGCPDRREQGT
jgi:hypothetical protein